MPQNTKTVITFVLYVGFSLRTQTDVIILQWCRLVPGDREREDVSVCDSCGRAAPEERGETEEDAGEDDDEAPVAEQTERRSFFFTMFVRLQVGALIVTPTRELALQISEVVQRFIEKFPQFT